MGPGNTVEERRTSEAANGEEKVPGRSHVHLAGLDTKEHDKKRHDDGITSPQSPEEPSSTHIDEKAILRKVRSSLPFPFLQHLQHRKNLETDRKRNRWTYA
jgi:hypothetical protein